MRVKNKMLIRILSKKGMVRVELPKNLNTTIEELNILIQEKTGTPVDGQILRLGGPEGLLIAKKCSKLLDIDDRINNGFVFFLETERENTYSTNDPFASLSSLNGSREIHGYTDSESRLRSTQPENAIDPSTRNFTSYEAWLSSNTYSVANPMNESLYRGIYSTANSRIKLPQAVTVQNQKYRHIDHLEWMKKEDVQNFVSFWNHELMALEQRCGFLYGYFLLDNSYDNGIRCVVEGVYEPRSQREFQLSSTGSNSRITSFLRSCFTSEEVIGIDTVMSKTGLSRVGCIFTANCRPDIITPLEIIDVAEMQRLSLRTHYTGALVPKFVTCVVRGTAEEPSIDVVMASDQLMGMVSSGVLDTEHQYQLKLRETRPKEILPSFVVSGKDKKSFEIEWFIVKVNMGVPIIPRSMFKRCAFKRANRPDVALQPRDITLTLSQNRGSRTIDRYSDFHLLVAISIYLGVETASTIAESLYNEVDIDRDLDELLCSELG